MSTYGLLPADHRRAAPQGAPLLPLFLQADLAREYRNQHYWTQDCEIAELPALEVLRTLLEASRQGVPLVAVNPAGEDGPGARFERPLDDPWTAFVDLLQFERAALSRGRFEPVAEGFSDPRLHPEHPHTLEAPADGRSEFEAGVLDLTAAQLLSAAGSVELAKHALDIVAEFAAERPSDDGDRPSHEATPPRSHDPP